VKADTTWFKKCGWGVFCHYLGERPHAGKELSGDDWSRRVDSFDVPRLAGQLENAGAPYFYITIGQISGHYCSPNATYDSIVGIRPSKCSRRDLVAEIADAVAPRGIDMLVYLAAEGPGQDVAARQRLGWGGKHWNDEDIGRGDVTTTWPDKRQRAFQLNWEKVVSEWSLRWGRKVRGWWIDGCYFKALMYEHDDAPNFQSFAAALKAGNPDSIVAFNGGVYAPVISWTEHEDYTCGEIAGALPVDPNVGRNDSVGGAQYHILSYLGQSWGRGPLRLPDELAAAYTKFVIQRGGVITWDVPIEHDGRIPDEFVRQLAAIHRALP